MHGYSTIVYVSRKNLTVSLCLLVQKLDIGVLFYSHPRNVKNHLTIANASVSIHQCKRPLLIISIIWSADDSFIETRNSSKHGNIHRLGRRVPHDQSLTFLCYQTAEKIAVVGGKQGKQSTNPTRLRMAWPAVGREKQWTDNWFQPVPSCGGLQQLQKQRLPQRHEKNRTPTKDLHALKSHELHNILTYWRGIKDDDGRTFGKTWKSSEAIIMEVLCHFLWFTHFEQRNHASTEWKMHSLPKK